MCGVPEGESTYQPPINPDDFPSALTVEILHFLPNFFACLYKGHEDAMTSDGKIFCRKCGILKSARSAPWTVYGFLSNAFICVLIIPVCFFCCFLEVFTYWSVNKNRVLWMFKRPTLSKSICKRCFADGCGREKKEWGRQDDWLWRRGVVNCVLESKQRTISDIPNGCYYSLEQVVAKK